MYKNILYNSCLYLYTGFSLNPLVDIEHAVLILVKSISKERGFFLNKKDKGIVEDTYCELISLT